MHPLWNACPDMFELLTLSLYTAGGDPVPVEMLVEITLEAPVGMLGFAPYADPAPAVRREWHAHLVDLLAALEPLGAIRTETSTDPAVRRTIRAITGRKDADLTPRRAHPDRSAGHEPVAGEPRRARSRRRRARRRPAHRAVRPAGPREPRDRRRRAGPVGRPSRRGEGRGGGRGHGRTAPDPGLRMWALAALDRVGEHGTAAALRLRAAEAGFVEDAFEGQPAAELVRMVAEVSRTDHPDRHAVLDAIADAPPTRAILMSQRAHYQYRGTLCSVLLRFSQAAQKHKVGKARVRHVIEHSIIAFQVPAEEDQDDDRTLYLGDDETGRVLEVLTVPIEDGELVIHAMDLRAKYRSVYDAAKEATIE